MHAIVGTAQVSVKVANNTVANNFLIFLIVFSSYSIAIQVYSLSCISSVTAVSSFGVYVTFPPSIVIVPAL